LQFLGTGAQGQQVRTREVAALLVVLRAVALLVATCPSKLVDSQFEEDLTTRAERRGEDRDLTLIEPFTTLRFAAARPAATEGGRIP
jgi:hypothetical protein